jgi:hypothetical protein
MGEGIDLFTEQQTGVEIVHVHGGAGERFDQVTLHGTEMSFATKVEGYAFGDGIELLASFCPAIQSVARQQTSLTLPVPTHDRGCICGHLRSAPECIQDAPIFVAAATKLCGKNWG